MTSSREDPSILQLRQLFFGQEAPDPELLLGLAWNLPEDLVERAIAIALRIEDQTLRARVLAALIGPLPPERRAQLLASLFADPAEHRQAAQLVAQEIARHNSAYSFNLESLGSDEPEPAQQIRDLLAKLSPQEREAQLREFLGTLDRPAHDQGARTISAWIGENGSGADAPLQVGVPAVLHFKVGDPVARSLIAGRATVVPAADVPAAGLMTEWTVIATQVALAALDDDTRITSEQVGGAESWRATFTLLIPGQGESATRRLPMTPLAATGAALDVLIHARGELYRQFRVDLTVGGGAAGAATIAADTTHAPAEQLGMRTPHEWQHPPGTLEIVVLDQAHAYASGDIVISDAQGGRIGLQVKKMTDWRGAQAGLAGLIDNLRAAAEQFRAKSETYLNDIDPNDLDQRLKALAQSPWRNQWDPADDQADGPHRQVWEQIAQSAALRDLAANGYDLYTTIFPPRTELRQWLDQLVPGHRLNLVWMDTVQGWIPSIPWGLMYLKDPTEPIDPLAFAGLRFRLQYTAHQTAERPRDLGSPIATTRGYCMYWGGQPNDSTAAEAEWQKRVWAGSPQLLFVPADQAPANPRQEVLALLKGAQQRPLVLLYFFCQCSIDQGGPADPVLRFGSFNQPEDIIRQIELPRTPLADRPLVFANACTTVAGDPYIANRLEQLFFQRECSAFLGTETKVPIQFASRFATIFFHFFYRQGDQDQRPMAAGEAVTQTRMFLWNQYRNIGGILYTYINQYELFMADAAELKTYVD